MARFLLAWELGGGMGHVVPLAQVAEPLVQRGHEVHFVLRDLSTAHAGLGALASTPRLRLWQAPVWLMPYQGGQASASYAELLFHAGYLDAERLNGLVQGWHSLLDAIDPDLLLADHAPTALLAARGRRTRCALMGNGFFVPPAVQPLPSFRQWERIDPQRLAYTEARALATCNAVLAAHGQPPLAALHELTRVDERFLLTWPELDHYGHGPQGRPGVRYWGALPARQQGAPAVWPEGDGPRLFAYLKHDYPAIEAVLRQLSTAPSRTLVHAAGLTAAQRQRHASASLRFSDGPVAMDTAMAQADAVLCHANSGTVCSGLQAGLPQLMLPMQVEQMILAQRVQACGVGEWLMADDVGSQLRPMLDRVLGDTGLRQRAQAMAERHRSVRQGDTAQRVAERCIELARTAPPPAATG